MSYFRMRYVALFVGAVCLVGAIFAPWLNLTDATFGLPAQQEFSPGAMIWGAIFNTPTIVRPLPLVVMCILYLSATLAIAGLAIPIVRGAEQGSYGVSRLAGSLMAGAVECGLFGLSVWLALPFMLEIGAPFPDSSAGPGLPLALIGSALAFIGLFAITITAHDRALSRA